MLNQLLLGDVQGRSLSLKQSHSLAQSVFEVLRSLLAEAELLLLLFDPLHGCLIRLGLLLLGEAELLVLAGELLLCLHLCAELLHLIRDPLQGRFVCLGLLLLGEAMSCIRSLQLIS